jgi:hypothetical protein
MIACLFNSFFIFSCSVQRKQDDFKYIDFCEINAPLIDKIDFALKGNFVEKDLTFKDENHYLININIDKIYYSKSDLIFDKNVDIEIFSRENLELCSESLLNVYLYDIKSVFFCGIFEDATFKINIYFNSIVQLFKSDKTKYEESIIPGFNDYCKDEKALLYSSLHEDDFESFLLEALRCNNEN